MKRYEREKILREILRNNRSGLIISQLVELSGMKEAYVRYTLAYMIDVYIGGWQPTESGLGFVQVIKAAEIPKDVKRPVLTQEMQRKKQREYERALYAANKLKTKKELDTKSPDYKPKTVWVKL